MSVSNVSVFSFLRLQFSSEMSGLEGVPLKMSLCLLQEEVGSVSPPEITLPDYLTILQDTEVCLCGSVCSSVCPCAVHLGRGEFLSDVHFPL